MLASLNTPGQTIIKAKKSRNHTELFFKTNQKASIIDIIYQPLKTKLIRISKAKKIKTENGLKINKLQAIKAFILANKISNSKIRNKILSI